MEITSPGTEAADPIADQWIDLASDQREHGSHILPGPNRDAVREAVLRRLVADELLVARENGDRLGFVMFGVETGKYDQDVTRGVVQNLYVVPEARGEGVGSDLLAAAERALADSGVDHVALEVMADNEDARRFYRRHGYAPHRVELEKRVESDTL